MSEQKGPLYGPGNRVSKKGEQQSGRVQSVTIGSNGFRCNVKWDFGPTTLHDEGDLQPERMPEHYP